MCRSRKLAISPDPLLFAVGIKENPPSGGFSRLSLRPLRGAACFLQTEFLSFFWSWIASHVSSAAQSFPKLGVEFHKSARDAVPHGLGLRMNAATQHFDRYAKPLNGFHFFQRIFYDDLQFGIWKIDTVCLVIYKNTFVSARKKTHAGDRCFSAADGLPIAFGPHVAVSRPEIGRHILHISFGTDGGLGPHNGLFMDSRGGDNRRRRFANLFLFLFYGFFCVRHFRIGNNRFLGSSFRLFLFLFFFFVLGRHTRLFLFGNE